LQVYQEAPDTDDEEGKRVLSTGSLLRKKIDNFGWQDGKVVKIEFDPLLEEKIVEVKWKNGETTYLPVPEATKCMVEDGAKEGEAKEEEDKGEDADNEAEKDADEDDEARGEREARKAWRQKMKAKEQAKKDAGVLSNKSTKTMHLKKWVNEWNKAAPFAPDNFKNTMAECNFQFEGNNQEDAQELMASLLDLMHEDLNRVGKKPMVEDADNFGERPDEETAAEAWCNYLRRCHAHAPYTMHHTNVVTLFAQGQECDRRLVPGAAEVHHDVH
jgi:hypothetical protein